MGKARIALVEIIADLSVRLSRAVEEKEVIEVQLAKAHEDNKKLSEVIQQFNAPKESLESKTVKKVDRYSVQRKMNEMRKSFASHPESGGVN